MESLKDTANNLKKISLEAAMKQEQKRQAFKPILTDKSYIPSIRKWVIEEYSKLDDSIKLKYSYKNYFLMIVIFLYSPQSMAEVQLADGVRKALGKELDTHSTRISHSLSKVRDWIFIYKDFEQSLNYLYGEIKNRLKGYE